MTEQKPDFKKIILGIVIGSLGLAAIINGGYRYSQKNSKIALPISSDYSGQNPPTAPLIFTATAETPWTEVKGLFYPYLLSAPETLTLERFSDPIDGLGISWGNLDPKLNLLLNVEEVKKNAPKYVGKPKEYVQNWWKFFSGLSGVKSVDRFINAKGLVGYKATYLTPKNEIPNINVFFEIDQDPNIMIHLANGILDQEIFNRIVDGFDYAPTPTTAPTTNP